MAKATDSNVFRWIAGGLFLVSMSLAGWAVASVCGTNDGKDASQDRSNVKQWDRLKEHGTMIGINAAAIGVIQQHAEDEDRRMTQGFERVEKAQDRMDKKLDALLERGP